MPRMSIDPCQPHGETNVLSNTCWGAGAEPSCFSCYYGPRCREFNASAGCRVDAKRNFFLLWQDLFEPPNFPMSPALPASWAMPYQSESAVPPLDDAIRSLHRMVGNADPDGKKLLLCTGARGCILAVLWAINRVYGPSSPAALQVFARAPYFAGYPYWVGMASSGAPNDATWNVTADPAEPTSVELLASPNNPDGAALRPLVRNRSHVVCDLVYNWGWNHRPVADLGCETTIFSLSKATGHAGTRVGWALLSDPDLYREADEYVRTTAGGVSVEAQARTLSILSPIVSSGGRFFAAARPLLEARWDALDRALAPCVASGLVAEYNRDERGPLLWLAAPDGKDGVAMLAVAGIDAEAGASFGATPRHARVNLVGSNSSWGLLLPRLRHLCATPPAAVWALADRQEMAGPGRGRGSIHLAVD